MKFLALTLLALAGLLAPSTASSQEKITLAQVLARAGAYVDEFQRQLSSIVAEETYLQEVAPDAGSTVGQNRRALRSDLLLLRPERSLTWVQYRDVFEVDGSPVLDRGERITSQSFNATALTAERVNRIRSESARYNIGDIERTLNVPVLPLVILSRRVQPQFRFTVDAAGGRPPRGAETRVPDTPHFRISAQVWIVRFEERARPTLVRTPRGASIPSRGRFWIEPQTGRVLMSELITENDDVRAQVNVSYQSEPVVGLLVPIEMHERYAARRYKATITGQASYGKFRRLQVDVREQLTTRASMPRRAIHPPSRGTHGQRC